MSRKRKCQGKKRLRKRIYQKRTHQMSTHGVDTTRGKIMVESYAEQGGNGGPPTGKGQDTGHRRKNKPKNDKCRQKTEGDELSTGENHLFTN